MSAEKSFQAWSRALRELSREYEKSKDSFERAILLSHVAQIELLQEINAKLNRIPIHTLE